MLIGEEPALKAAVSASLLRTKRLRKVFEKKDLPSFFTIGLADHNPTLQLNIHRWFSQASPDLQFSLAMSAQGGFHGSSISPMASSSTDSATTQLPSASLDPSLSDLQPVQSVLQLLPLYVKVAIERDLGLAGNSLHVRKEDCLRLSDIVADYATPVTLRFSRRPDDTSYDSRERELSVIMDIKEAMSELKSAQQKSGGSQNVFQSNNRMGVSGCLHRISALKDRQGDMCGLTYRIGRHIPGLADTVIDLVIKVAEHNAAGRDSGSLLLLGPPGAGKTTLLRDITRQLADIFHKVVIVVDTSDEIAGGGRMAHECIGRARRMGGTAHQSKYEVLEEAVANHGPEVVVIDEIGNAKEVAAVKDIAQRGVKMVATVHGTTLQHMLENPVLNPLVGGKQKMVIGDLAARSWNGRKTRSERCEAPTFSTIVEIRDRQNWYIHQDVAASVDDILNGSVPSTESR
ncbi:R3H domain [Trebouxia sp. C0009 RCD-2024]